MALERLASETRDPHACAQAIYCKENTVNDCILFATVGCEGKKENSEIEDLARFYVGEKAVSFETIDILLRFSFISLTRYARPLLTACRLCPVIIRSRAFRRNI